MTDAPRLTDERLEEIASSLGKSKVYGEITNALRELQERRAQQSPREAALTTFAREVLQCAFEGHDYSGGVAQDRATELGLLTRTTYDPEKHGEHDCCETGDDFYVFSDWLSPAQKETR